MLAFAGAIPSASARVELSASGPSVVVEVSDDAPATLDVVGDRIVPIRWERAGRSRGTLPLIRLPGATPTLAVDVAGERFEIAPDAATPRLRIDPHSYEVRVDAPRSERQRTLGAAATATLGLLLAMRLRRHAVAAIVAVAACGAVAIALAARRPDVGRVDAAGATWFVARRATVARVPIRPGEAWVPVVESAEHLRSLSPRVRVGGGGEATLELTLPPGGRIALVRAGP